MPLDPSVLAPAENTAVAKQKTKVNDNLDAILSSEGAEHLAPVVRALYAQETGSGTNARTSTDGARGPMQIMPGTFRQLARPGESIDNPEDNLRVGVRLVKALGDKFNNDPARIAAGYFSGEGNVTPSGDQVIRHDRADGNGKRVSSYVQDVLKRLGDVAIPSAQAADVTQLPIFKEGTAADDKVASLSIFKDGEAPDDKVASLSIFKEAPAAAPVSAEQNKPSSLLEDVKKAVHWREGEKITVPEGMTDASAEPVEPPPGPKVASSVLDGSPLPETSRATADTGGVPLRPERLKQLQAIARDQPKTAAKIAAQDNWAGQAMRAVLEQQGNQVARLQQGDNLVAPNRTDMAARVTTPRQTELTSGGEDNAKIAYNQKGPAGKSVANVTQGVEQGMLDFRDGIIGAGQAALRAAGAEQSADLLQRHQEDLKARAANLDLPSSAQYSAATAQAVARSITSNIPGLLTGAEVPALATMGLQVFGQEYGAGRAANMTDAEAVVRAGIFGAAEIIGEKFGLGDTLKGLKAAANGMPTSEVVKYFGRAMAKEIPGEELTSALQFGADKFLPQGLNQQATMDDYLRVVADTLVQTVLQSGVMMAGGAGATKAVQALETRFPKGALARALREQVEGAQFDPAATDRAARLALDPNADSNTVVAPEATGFAPAKPVSTATPTAAAVQQQPVTAAENPLDNAPISNPIASELAQLEGANNDQTEAGAGAGISDAGRPSGAQEAGQQGSAGQARETGANQGVEAGREETLGGIPLQQHTPGSLNFLMTAHPDQVVRDQAAAALEAKQAYTVATPTPNGPVESQVDSALKGQIDDSTIQTLVRANGGRPLSFASPQRVRNFTDTSGGMGAQAEPFAQLIRGISGRDTIIVRGAGFRGAVFGRSTLFLSHEQGEEGLVATAFHELRHALADDHPDLSAFWSDAVHQHLDTGDSALLHFLSNVYQEEDFAPPRIAAMRAKGRTDSQILNALLSANTGAISFEEEGRGSKRDWAVEELEADALGNAANREGVVHKALEYMAKVDIGVVKQFAQFIQGILKRIDKAFGKGYGDEVFVKGSTQAEVRARLEALDKAATEVLGRYASRTQNQKRMQGATPAELLLIRKSHPDSVVRDMAEAELKKRETEAAYQQKEEQKAGEKENFKKANEQARLDQAEAQAKAAGTDDGTPTAMAQALAGMKKDVQSLRRQLAKEMKKAAATARGQAQVRAEQLADNEAGRFSKNREQTLPTRWPTSKRMTPSVSDPMLADLETLRQTPKLLEQAINAIAEEPGMRVKARRVEGKLDAVLDKLVSNLLWLHDQVPADIRQRSKLWYDGAGEIASKWAKQYDKSRSQTAGILAVLSPQKDWFMNVTMAERILDILSTQMDHRFDDKMRGAAFKFLVKDFAKAEDSRDNMAAFNAIKDKTLREAVETGDLRQAGIWLRAYDEAYHDPRHAVIHPEGDFGENARTMKGTETLRAWGDFGALGKAASIFMDGSLENINQKLGGEHKVRNFYNNIFAPKDARFTTIDTHAVAADMLRPLAGADKPVADNFGSSGGSDLTGVSGTYPIHYEAYKRAAEARGVLPREMQSITWEAVRGLFTEGFKGKKENLKAIDKIWREVDKGKLTVAEARQQITSMAGGMEHPDWWNGQEPNPSGRAKSYEQTRPAFTGNKIVFEVAPDPHNEDLTRRWNDLPEETKARISYDVAWDTAGKLLGYYNSDTIKGELHTQVGGYLDNTNPSFSLWMNKYASMVKVQELANTLGYVLNQDSMVIGSPKKFKGGTEMGYVRVTNVSDTNAKKVYDELRATILDEGGNPLINGHTTAEGSMVILVDLGSEDAVRQRVVAVLNDDHGVGSGTTFVQWPERGEDDYGYGSRQGEAGRGGAESPLREYAHNLRREASDELERRITARFSPDRGYERAASGAVDPGRGGRNDQGLGRVDVSGTHFSQQQRDHLTGVFFGSGIKGQEADRIQSAKDARLKSRLYAYVDEGQGVFPEAGVGSFAHAVKFDNLYDLKADPLGIRQKTQDANERESLVLDAGFDGYYAPGVFGRQGVAILLGGAATRGVKPGKVAGPAQPAPQASASPLAGRRDLPGGKMTGAEWKKLVPEAKVEDDKSYYKDDIRFSPQRRFYSQLARSFDQAPDRVFGPASQVKAWLQSNAGKLGIKQDEIQWTGINDWLDLQGKAKVSKADVANYLAQNGVQVEEVEKGDAGYNENDPQLPAGSGLRVITATDDATGYEVLAKNGRVIGNGETEADAIADAYSSEPEHWEKSDSTKYESYVLPGGENYRELLLTLPEKHAYPKTPVLTRDQQNRMAELNNKMRRDGNLPAAEMAEWRTFRDQERAYADELEQLKAAGKNKDPYRSAHWGEDNILAHVRFNDRTDADGNKVLFIEELQSDWGQDGKKKGFDTPRKTKPMSDDEYNAFMTNMKEAAARYLDEKISDMDAARRVANSTPLNQVAAWAGMEDEYAQTIARREEDRADSYGKRTVPAAPFVTDTKAWLSLGIKRMVAYAVENGYDKVAFVNGRQSAERYDLSKQVDVIYAGMAADGKYLIGADKGRNRDIINKKVTREELPDLVGKDLAEKIVQDVTDEDTNAEYRGLDLAVGGAGMKTFYDKIVPQTINDVLKKLGGGKAETVRMEGEFTEEQKRKFNGAYATGTKDDIAAAKAMKKPLLDQVGFAVTPAMKEKVQGGMPLFSPTREQWKAVRAAWLQIADQPSAFKFPKSDGDTLAKVMADIDPGIRVSQRGVMGDLYNKGVRERYVVFLPGGKDAEVSVKANGRMWVNASQLKASTGTGTKLYQGLLNYAHNTNKVLVGDPYGVSDLATFRRTEQMLSAALKFGTTDFMEPSNTQRTPKAFKDSIGHTDGVIEKFADLDWTEGDDSANLANLLNVSYTNITTLVPEVQDVRYDFNTDSFKHAGSDRLVTPAEWKVLSRKLESALRGRRSPQGGSLAGAPELLSDNYRSVTLQRAVLTGSILRGEGGTLGRPVLAEGLGKLRELRPGRGDDPLFGDRTEGAGRDPAGPVTEDGARTPLQGILYSRVRDAIDRTIAKVDHAVDGLSNLPNQFDYLSDRYRALGKIARVDEIIGEIRKGFDGVPQADKAAAYTYLTTRGASLSIIGNPEARAMAKRIKDTINYVGDALVARGLLDPAARAHYKDQYLPRMYLKHLMSEADWKMIGAGKKPSDMGYLKGRKDIAPEVRELILGEVKDPAFLSANAIGRAMRDVSLLDWMGRISQNNDWVFPQTFVTYNGQRVSAYWLRAEADRIDAQIPHYTPANQIKAKALTDNMRQLANQALGNLQNLDHTKYKQIPDTHRYGLLRGMWLRKEIYNDIMGASQIVNADPTWFEDWFGFGGKGTKLTQWWKFSKVALNPPGQVRNFLSNMVMLQLSGVGLHKLPVRLIQAVREITNDGPHWKVAKKYGVTESTFTAQELHRVKRDLLALEAQAGGLNPLTWLRAAGAHLLERVSDLYQFSEALGKTIKIIDEMANGKSEAEAAIEAQKWLFDYSLVPQSIRLARNSPVGMPFITYQIKAAPRLMEVAMKYPWRFLPWVGLFYGMQAYVAGLFGVDDDELKKLKKSLPEWLQDRSHTVFMPTRDADGRLQVADVGYFFPWTFFSQTGMHLANGDLKKALVDDVGGQFSAPIIGAAAALMSNYNTFTHKPIYEEADPTAYKAAAIANYAYDLMAPPFISSHGFASPMGLADKQYGGKMVQAMTGTTNKFGDPKATEAQALAGLLGFNFYGMDPEHTRATNLLVSAKKVQAAEQQLKYKLMDRGLTEEQRAKYIQDYRERMVELASETRKYAEESEVPEQLKPRK